MKILVRPRQYGKTYEAVQWVKEGEQTDSYPFWTRVLVTSDVDRATRLRREYGLDYRQVFAAEEWRKARLGTKPVKAVVDDAETILNYYLGFHPDAITMTGIPVATLKEN